LGELEIAIPSNILEDCQSLSAKSQKLSLIARSASIFQINKIYIYKVKRRDDSRFISLLLNYLVTPQYLRKKLFPISNALKFAGALPPLKIPSHLVSKDLSSFTNLQPRQGLIFWKILQIQNFFLQKYTFYLIYPQKLILMKFYM